MSGDSRMKCRSFRHNYHDGQLSRYTLGPRRELTLEVALDPVWNRETSHSALVRFGGVENFDEVASYFRGLPAPPGPDAYIAEVVDLGHLEDSPNWVVVELAGYGQIRIHSRHVAEV